MALEFFPIGIAQYIIGGILVGFGLSLIFITTGLVSGASTFFTSTLSYFSNKPYFNQQQFVTSRTWRLVFAAGFILGGFIFMLFINNGTPFVTQVQLWRLVIGGFLIGLGARMSLGCTSGHGVCGLASFQLPSLAAVVAFLSIAIITALAISNLGVVP